MPLLYLLEWKHSLPLFIDHLLSVSFFFFFIFLVSLLWVFGIYKRSLNLAIEPPCILPYGGVRVDYLVLIILLMSFLLCLVLRSFLLFLLLLSLVSQDLSFKLSQPHVLLLHHLEVVL